MARTEIAGSEFFELRGLKQPERHNPFVGLIPNFIQHRIAHSLPRPVGEEIRNDVLLSRHVEEVWGRGFKLRLRG